MAAGRNESVAESRDIPTKWRRGAAGATADTDNLRRLINTSSIMVGNATSIMAREAAIANAD
ncbi:MAG TPA: hypothetical protein VGC36_07625 [Rhizomicrobium sp.]